MTSRDPAAVKFLGGLGLAALATLLWACSGEYPQSSIDPRTDFAQSIHSLYVMIFWITLAILILVWGLMAYVIVKFRARPGTPHPRQIHGHLGIEILWTLVPAVLVVVIAIPTIQTVFRTQRAPASDALIVDVIGHQWWWEVRYPDGVFTANELHLPVGRPISLRLQSADVIHSFWVPMLGGKRDLNPVVRRPEGDTIKNVNWLHFTINEAGLYRGQCAEFCGQSHSIMGVRVIAETPAEFDAWKAAWRGPARDTVPLVEGNEQAEVAASDSIAASLDSAVVAGAGGLGGGGSARIELGRQTFHSATCIACHAIQGTTAAGPVGPNLTLLGRRTTIVGWLDNTPENIARWITSPRSIKPGAHMPGVAEEGGNFPPTNLSEEQVRAVAEYLWSLGREPGEPVTSSGAAGG